MVAVFQLRFDKARLPTPSCYDALDIFCFYRNTESTYTGIYCVLGTARLQGKDVLGFFFEHVEGRWATPVSQEGLEMGISHTATSRPGI